MEGGVKRKTGGSLCRRVGRSAEGKIIDDCVQREEMWGEGEGYSDRKVRRRY